MLACQNETPVPGSENEPIAPARPEATVKGVFLLNEGMMGSNKASIDFMDYTTGLYHRNLYPERNPSIVKELGDVGNDIAVHNGKLYAMLTGSGYVEVMDAHTVEHLGGIDLPGCRYIAFHEDKAYITSYAGPISSGNDLNKRPGKVVEVDTQTLTVTREVTVGYQPEELLVIGSKLYVANSGGYSSPDYDRTVSVIDLASFQVTNTFDVAINLERMQADSQGNIYVSSRGNYGNVAADVYVINSQNGQVTGSLGVPANDMVMLNDKLYMISTSWNNETGNSASQYLTYDTRQQAFLPQPFITDGTEQGILAPYGLAVNPETGEILVTDALSYTTPGLLYCFGTDGKKKWQIMTGDLPKQMAFTTEAFQ